MFNDYIKKSLLFILGSVHLFIASEMNAQSKSILCGRFYIRGDAGVAIPANKFKKSKDENDPYITKRPKQATVYNIGVGYKISDNIRTDLNFSYRYFKYNAESFGFGVLEGTAIQNIKTYSAFINGYFDCNCNKIFKPYLTAGIGYGRNKSSDLVDTVTLLRYLGTDKNNFIWNVGLGTRFIISDIFNLDISYKYADLGSTKTNNDPDDPDSTPSSQKIRSHEIMGGVIIHL